MEKASIAANLNTTVEMGMSYTKDTTQNLFTYFAGGLVQNIPDQLQDGSVERELSAGEYIVCRVEAEKYYRDLECMACMEIWVKPLPLKNKS